jgi:hypothetical protein
MVVSREIPIVKCDGGNVSVRKHVGPISEEFAVDILIKPGKTQHAVAGLLSKRIRKRAEKSRNLGPQTVESNEINMIEKTLNQKVGGSIPPRPTSLKSRT